MDLLGEKYYKESIITLEDFSVICRICCLKQSDLRPLQEENYLLDVFHAIRKIDVRSTVEFPKNVCKECFSQLEDISLFFDISKSNNANFGKNIQPETEISEYTDEIESGTSQNIKLKKENGEDMFTQGSPICRICLFLANSPKLFERKTNMIQLFDNITNIAKAEFNNSKNNNICHKCNSELEKISSFVTSSLRNDQKLEHAIGRNTTVKTENDSNPIDFESSMCQELKLESDIGSNETMTENAVEEFFFLHKSEVKTENIDIKEEIMDNGLVTSTDNEEHLIGSEKNPLICDYCKKSFTRKWDLQQHLLTHSGKKSFKCGCCEKSFNTRSNLQQHMSTHSGKKPFQCESCEKKFRSKQSLQRHMLTLSGKKSFRCDQCEKCFTQKISLQEHMLIHNGKQSFNCDCCKKIFISKRRLTCHMRTHIGKKPFKCDVCEKCFGQKGHLQEHTLIHNGKTSLKCTICEKKFISKLRLNRHMSSHSGEKPFKCDFCEKKFTRKQYLLQHMLTHTEKKPFKCDGCGKCYIWKSALHDHKLTHAGEKSFRCDICEKSFIYQCYLERHKLTHSVEKKRN